MQTKWTDTTDSEGARTKEFYSERAGKRALTGAVWLPDSQNQSNTLICFGHGASGDRYQAPICTMAQIIVNKTGAIALSLDGPAHGLRAIGEGGRDSFYTDFTRESSITDMSDDWNCAVSVVSERFGLQKPSLGYFGLSMGTIFGIPFLSTRHDVKVAILGLMGVAADMPHGEEIIAAAQKIKMPVMFLMQLDDEMISRERYLALYDELAASHKRIHANPGLHPEVPEDEIEFATTFLIEGLMGTLPTRKMVKIAE